jgi:hypothetical protein
MESWFIVLLVLLAIGFILSPALRRKREQNEQGQKQTETTPTGDEWPVLANFDNPIQATMARDRLRNQGLDAITETESPTIVEGADMLLDQVVRVPANQLSLARNILKGSDFENYLVDDADSP